MLVKIERDHYSPRGQKVKRRKRSWVDVRPSSIPHGQLYSEPPVFIEVKTRSDTTPCNVAADAVSEEHSRVSTTIFCYIFYMMCHSIVFFYVCMLIPSQSNDSLTKLVLGGIPDLTSGGSVVSALSSIGSNSARHLLPRDMVYPSDQTIINVIRSYSGLSSTAKSLDVGDLRRILESLSLHQSYTGHPKEEEVDGTTGEKGTYHVWC